MIDYKFFTDFQKELYNEHGYMLDKLNNTTDFWYYNSITGQKSYRDVYAHNYYLQYAKKFDSKRMSALKVLEIGVNHGYSLLLWERYFPNAQIYGIDIDLSHTARGKTPKELLKDKKRIKLFEFDACDKKKVDEFVKENGEDFDIIIEDGSHLGHHQILSTFYYMPLLKENGIMVIEDIGLYYQSDIDDYMISQLNPDAVFVNGDKIYGTPIYEYFMLNYKKIKNNISHKLNVFTLNKNDMKLLDNIDIEWIEPFNSQIIFEDIDLQSQNATMRESGIAKMAFLTYKNSL